MNKTIFQTIALVLSIANVLGLFPNLAAASHLGGSTISWTRGAASNESGGVTVNFEVYFAAETTGTSISTSFHFGDGTSTPLDLDYDVVFEGLSPLGQYYRVLHATFSHEYAAEDIATNSAFQVGFSDCCRYSTVVNSNGSFIVPTVVDLSPANLASPKHLFNSVALPLESGTIVELQLPVLSQDGDPVKCSLKTGTGVGLTIPQIENGEALTISEDCKLRFDLTGATLNDLNNRYAIQLVMEETNRAVNYLPLDIQQSEINGGGEGSSSSSGSSVVSGLASAVSDFVVEIVKSEPEIALSCTSNAPLSATIPVGQFASYNYQCVATELPQPAGTPPPFGLLSSGDGLEPQREEVTMYTFGGPENAVFTPNNGANGFTPFNATFEWAPVLGQSGKTFPTYVLFTRKGKGEIEPPARSLSGTAKMLGSNVVLFPTVLSVPANQSPVCTLAASEVSCSAGFTSTKVVTANVSDPDGTEPLISWQVSCPAALDGKVTMSTLPDARSIQFSADANSLPAATQCAITLTASDSLSETKCESTVTVNACGRDCANITNGTSVVDQCGVCGGDGSSCLGCTTVSNAQNSTILDGNAAHGARLVQSAARIIRNDIKVSASKRRSISRELVRVSKAAYQIAWTTAWSLTPEVSVCTNSNLCVSTSLLPVITSYSTEVAKYYPLVQKARKAATSGIVKKKLDQIRKKLKALEKLTVESIKQVPTANYTCQ